MKRSVAISRLARHRQGHGVSPGSLLSDYRSLASREIARCCMPHGNARAPARTMISDAKKRGRGHSVSRAGAAGRRTNKRRRALIIGGSMSGPFAALMLQRPGRDVGVFERVATALAGRGAGILAPPELIS